MAREAVVLIIGLAGQAPSRRSRLSSNVRQHHVALKVLAIASGAGPAAGSERWAPVPASVSWSESFAMVLAPVDLFERADGPLVELACRFEAVRLRVIDLHLPDRRGQLLSLLTVDGAAVIPQVLEALLGPAEVVRGGHLAELDLVEALWAFREYGCPQAECGLGGGLRDVVFQLAALVRLALEAQPRVLSLDRSWFHRWGSLPFRCL